MNYCGISQQLNASTSISIYIHHQLKRYHVPVPGKRIQSKTRRNLSSRRDVLTIDKMVVEVEKPRRGEICHSPFVDCSRPAHFYK